MAITDWVAEVAREMKVSEVAVVGGDCANWVVVVLVAGIVP